MDEKDKLFKVLRYAIIAVIVYMALRLVFGVFVCHSLNDSDKPSWLNVDIESLTQP